MTVPTTARRWTRRALLALTWTVVGVGVVGRLLLGFDVNSVVTDSMAPAYQRGDLVLSRLVDASAVRVGDVPVVVPPGQSLPYVHRIVAVDRSTGAAVLRTRGDANTADDAWSARLTTTKVPVVVAVAPGLGRLTLLVQDPRTRALLIALLGLVVTTLAVREVLHLPLVVPPARSSFPVPKGTS